MRKWGEMKRKRDAGPRLTLAFRNIILNVERGAAKAVSLLQVFICLARFRLQAGLFYFIQNGQDRFHSLQNLKQEFENLNYFHFSHLLPSVGPEEIQLLRG